MTDQQGHTPGPWHVPPDDLAGQAQRALEGLPPFPGRAVVGSNGTVTCVVLTGPPGADANARLIATAPDLLAACEAMRSGLTKLTATANGIVATEYGQLVAAITKAKAEVR